ncbi:MAG: hypothetical protein V2I27_14870 [Erythrobacter sp.]|jgi:hypothetical protein|nr:hypothetical protein [Erythrobacter sp.]
MTSWTNAISKGMLGTVAAGAMALASATPALADDHRDRDRDRGGIGAEEIIAGAVVIGGIAALAGAFDGDRDRDWRDRRYNDRRFAHNGFGGRGGQGAVNACVRAAENQARRFGGWRFAGVTQVRDVDQTRRGLRVRGRIEVQDNRRFRDNFDRGRFTCFLDGRGRPFVDFDGIRGLR